MQRSRLREDTAMFQDHSLFLILQHMGIKSIFQCITVCKFWQESIENYMKRSDIETNLIDCGENMELAIKLAERGFKVKLDMRNNYVDYTDDLMKALGKMYHLNFSGMNPLRNKHLPFLSEVHTLNISNCENITDISMLKGVSNLDISWCGISDISVLGEGKIHTLNISGTRLKEIPILASLRHINTSYTRFGPEDVEKLQNLESFTCKKEYLLKPDQSEIEVPDGISRVRFEEDEDSEVGRTWENLYQLPKSVEELYLGLTGIFWEGEPGSIRKTISHLPRLKKIYISSWETGFDEEIYEAIEHFQKDGRNIELIEIQELPEEYLRYE